MKSEKHIRVLSLGIAMLLMLLGISCQRSPSEPDDEFIQHLQTLSDSSSLKKQDSQAKDELTTEDLDAIRGHSLEGSSSNKSVELSPMVGYGLLALIIIGFALGFYFIVIKRIKNGIGDLSYQIKHAKDKLEDTIDQQLPKNIDAEEKEGINELLEQLKKFDKKSQ